MLGLEVSKAAKGAGLATGANRTPMEETGIGSSDLGDLELFDSLPGDAIPKQEGDVGDDTLEEGGNRLRVRETRKVVIVNNARKLQ